jgi:septal ring factor EnvC (AmiA/AmiB activator)
MTVLRPRIRLAALAAGPAAALAVVALATPATGDPQSSGDLQSRIDAARSKESAVQGAMNADANAAASYQGRIDDLASRLVEIEGALAVERQMLVQVKAQLRAAQAHLLDLKVKFASDRKALARQLVGEYEADRPDLVTVVLNAHGFAALLEQADALRVVGHHDAQVVTRVRDEKRAVALETVRLAKIETRRQQVAAAQAIQEQEVGQLRSALIARQAQFLQARARKGAELVSLRSRRQALEQELAKVQARAAAAAGAPAASGAPFVGSGGSGGGFFPAPGTNYSVGEEPQIAARLDRLGRALGLHLIGISGYRTPQHSVEVGGFADDPHTQGRASDTPGVEGVPEATLERFGLTRPFAGAAEADHIQLLGG